MFKFGGFIQVPPPTTNYETLIYYGKVCIYHEKCNKVNRYDIVQKYSTIPELWFRMTKLCCTLSNITEITLNNGLLSYTIVVLSSLSTRQIFMLSCQIMCPVHMVKSLIWNRDHSQFVLSYWRSIILNVNKNLWQTDLFILKSRHNTLQGNFTHRPNYRLKNLTWQIHSHVEGTWTANLLL